MSSSCGVDPCSALAVLRDRGGVRQAHYFSSLPPNVLLKRGVFDELTINSESPHRRERLYPERLHAMPLHVRVPRANMLSLFHRQEHLREQRGMRAEVKQKAKSIPR